MRATKSVSLVAMLAATVAIVASASTASAAGVCSASTPQYCPVPSVQTTVATNVTSSSATLNGTANPGGVDTSCAFVYGTTTGYGQTTPLQSMGAGSSAVPVSAVVSGLAASTTYHFQLVCANAGQFGFGGDKTFTTLSSPAFRTS